MDININSGFVSLISILFGILGANSISLWSKNNSLGLTGNSIVGVFSSVLYIKTIKHIFHFKNNSIFLLLIFIGSFIIGLAFVFFTKKALIKFNATK